MPVTDVNRDLDALTLTITAEFDAGAHDRSPGGRAAYFMTSPEGQKYHGCWRIEEAEPPSRLRFEDGFADDKGNPNPELPTTIATVTIAETDGATTMSTQSKFGSREGMEQVIEMGMEQGMVEALGQIDTLLAGERA